MYNIENKNEMKKSSRNKSTELGANIFAHLITVKIEMQLKQNIKVRKFHVCCAKTATACQFFFFIFYFELEVNILLHM